MTSTNRNPGKPVLWSGLTMVLLGMVVSLTFGPSVGFNVPALQLAGGWLSALGVCVAFAGGIVWLVFALTRPRRVE